MKLDNEPTLNTIDDYNNNETPEKRKTVHLIIGGLIVFAIILGVVKAMNNSVSDYIGTSENPGIMMDRH